MTRSRRLFLCSVAACALSCVARAQSDGFPSKTITLIVPFAPGGASDNVARVMSQRLSEDLGKPMVVDNRPGAGGNVAAEQAARQAPDGHTLFLGNVSTNAINATTYAGRMKVNPLRDMAPVSMVVTVPAVLTASGKFAPNSVAEFVAYAKSRPGEINYSSAGIGSYPHIDMLILERAAGLRMVHVPYKGGAGQFTVALVAGEVQIGFSNASSVLPLIRAGKLKALAVTSPQRLPELPDTPTMAEVGYPNIGTNAWQGIFVPVGTPAPVIQRLHASLQKVLARPDVKESLAKMMIEAQTSSSPAEFSRFVEAENAKWSKVATEMNVRAEE